MFTLKRMVKDDELVDLYNQCDLSDEFNNIAIFEKDKKNTTNYIEFDEDLQINKIDRYIYVIAVISGLLTGIIDTFFTGELSLVDAQNWGDEKVNSLVMRVAKREGYEGDDLKEAIRLLENNYKIPADKVTAEFGGGLQHHLRDFTHHCSLVGLLFSIVTQFTGKAYGTDNEGNFVSYEVPTDMLGANIIDKLYQGVVTWSMHLISDMAGSSGASGRGTGIPGPLLSFFKEISSIPIFNKIKIQYEGDKIGLSVFVSKLFNGTYWGVNTDPNRLKFDLRMEIGISHEISKQAVPVIINECIVRGCYSIAAFAEHTALINKISDLKELDYKEIIPFNNKKISRMLVISTGVFSATNIVAAYIKSKCVEEDKHVEKFFVSLNYMGIFRFCVASSTDVKYTIEDIRQYSLSRKEMREKIESIVINNENIFLDENAQEVLYNLKNKKVMTDIDNTKFKVKTSVKEKWYNAWLEKSNEETTYNAMEMEEIYSKLLYYKTNSEMVFYKILIELIRFVPYCDLYKGSYNKLMNNYDFERKILYKDEIVGLYELRLLEREFDIFYKEKMAKKVSKWIVSIAIVTYIAYIVVNTFSNNRNTNNDNLNV